MEIHFLHVIGICFGGYVGNHDLVSRSPILIHMIGLGTTLTNGTVVQYWGNRSVSRLLSKLKWRDRSIMKGVWDSHKLEQLLKPFNRFHPQNAHRMCLGSAYPFPSCRLEEVKTI
jgi:hypothetical protein